MRDISKSSVDGISGNSGGRRLLRLCLTDGHSEITAIEYSHIPFIPDSVVPGTKVMPFLLSFFVSFAAMGMWQKAWFLLPLVILY